jgi:histidinol-phosphate aminotransferase
MTGRVRAQSGLEHITTYVPGRPVEEVQRELGLTDVIKLASNENPLPPSAKALAAMREALPQVNSYPDGDWYRLRHALAAHLGVRPDEVAVGNGADGLIMQTCMAYVDQDDEVIVSCSSFPVYDVYALAMRGRLIKIPLKDYALDLEAMAKAITSRTKLVFVCNPNNPTGTIVTADEVDRFLDRIPEDVLVVLDEAYYEFVNTSDFPRSIDYVRAGRANVIVLRTFSKVYGLAGIRVGYGIAHANVLAPIHKVREPFAVNLIAQAAGIGALQDREHLVRSVDANHAGREYLYREFDRLGLFYVKSHTNFVLVKVGQEANRIIQALLEAGVIVRPCGGYELPEFLRITVGDPRQNRRVIEALENAVLAHSYQSGGV